MDSTRLAKPPEKPEPERVLARGEQWGLLSGRDVCSDFSVLHCPFRAARYMLRLWAALVETNWDKAGRATPGLDAAAAERAMEELMAASGIYSIS